MCSDPVSTGTACGPAANWFSAARIATLSAYRADTVRRCSSGSESCVFCSSLLYNESQSTACHAVELLAACPMLESSSYLGVHTLDRAMDKNLQFLVLQFLVLQFLILGKTLGRQQNSGFVQGRRVGQARTRGDLEAHLKHAALALHADILGPLDEPGEVLHRLDVVANTEHLCALLEERVLDLLGCGGSLQSAIEEF